MSYRDLAKGRFSSESQIYFITTVVHQRRKLFVNLELCRNCILQMKQFDDEGHIETIAWVIMPDHIHWLFQLKDSYDLATVVKKFKGRSARKLNLLLGIKGTFWQHAYYDHALRNNEDIKQIARYIVANPLRAGLVERIEDYSYWDVVWL